MHIFRIALLTFFALAPSAVVAQSGRPMTQDELMQVTSNGVALKLGGEGEGYSGSLRLRKNGTGGGSVETDAGDKIEFTGTWEIKDGKFCRVWTEFNPGEEVCETWYLTSGTSVEVYNGDNRLGVNSW